MELLPSGRFARLTGLTVRAVRHYGELGHDQLDRSYRALQAVVERAGLEVAGEPREIYCAGPEGLPVERWLTEVQFPVVQDEARLAALG